MKNKQTSETLIVILSVLVILYIQTNAFKNFSPQLYSDNAIYAILMERFYNGDFNNAMHIWWQPLYPFIGSTFMYFGVSSPNALFYVSLFSNVLIFLPIFYLTKKITGNLFFSLLSGLLISFNLKLVESSFQLLTENLYVLLFTTAFTFSYFYLSDKKNKSVIFAAIFYGLGYLTRNEILLATQIFIGSMVVLLLSKNIKVKKFLIALNFFIFFFLLTISPYLYFNIQKFGYLNLSAKLNAAMSAPAYFAPQNNLTTTFAQDVWSVDSPDYDSRFFNEKYDFWKNRTNLIDTAKIRFSRYYTLIRSEYLVWEIAFFLVSYSISLIFFWKKKRQLIYLGLLLPFASIASIPFLPVVEMRYLYWIYPLVTIFSILGLFVIWNIVNKVINNTKLNQYKTPIVLSLSFLIVLFFYDVNKDNLALPSDFNVNTKSVSTYQIIGKYLRSLAKDKKVMYRLEPIIYYGHVRMIYIPNQIGPEELNQYARRWQTDYLIVDRFTFAPETPLGFLVDEAKAPTWLKPVKIWDSHMTKTVLYKFEF